MSKRNMGARPGAMSAGRDVDHGKETGSGARGTPVALTMTKPLTHVDRGTLAPKKSDISQSNGAHSQCATGPLCRPYNNRSTEMKPSKEATYTLHAEGSDSSEYGAGNPLSDDSINPFKADHDATIKTKESSPLAVETEIGPSANPDTDRSVDRRFLPFVSKAKIAPYSGKTGDLGLTEVNMRRDTGSSQTLIQRGVIPLDSDSYTNQDVLVTGVGGKTVSAPLHQVYVCSGLVESDVVVVGVVDTLPVDGVQVLLGNDLAGSRVQTEPIVSQVPVDSESTAMLESTFPECVLACVFTRGEKAKLDSLNDSGLTARAVRAANDDIGLADTFMSTVDGSESGPVSVHDIHLTNTRESIIEAQQSDPELKELLDQALSSKEAEKVPRCYMIENGLLVRKWRHPLAKVSQHWDTLYQIVVPKELRTGILELSHDIPTSSHLGVKKIKARVSEHFYWPGIGRDVAEYVRTCHTCQKVGKPNQKLKKVPLIPIPVMKEPFSQIIIDIVGPLVKTGSGFSYVLTVMCTATRFAQAFSLRTCTAASVSKVLLIFFTQYGFAKSIISDQGTHFTARVIDNLLKRFGIKHCFSSAYHAQTQGALERFHQTMKTMIRTYVYDYKKD